MQRLARKISLITAAIIIDIDAKYFPFLGGHASSAHVSITISDNKIDCVASHMYFAIGTITN